MLARISPRSRSRAVTLGVTLAIALYAYWALIPASTDLFFGAREQRVLGDGTDLRAVGWTYGVIRQALRDHPIDYFYGALFTMMRDAPSGASIWVTWFDKIVVPLISPFTTSATEGAALTFVILLVNGFSAYWCARALGWSRAIALGIALAWTVNPLVRARATVHTNLAATYFVPLIFGALATVARTVPRGRFPTKAMVAAAVAFLIASTTAHYYILICVVLSPFFFVFAIMMMRRNGGYYLRRTTLTVVAALPALLLLVWTFAKPVSAARAARLSPMPPYDVAVNRNYLESYGARPVDYLTGDIKLGDKDILRPRQKLTKEVIAHPVDANMHERANGVRWTALAIAGVFAIALLAERRRSRVRDPGDLGWFPYALSGAAFFLSLAPKGLMVYADSIAPSYAVFQVLPMLRIVNRYGVLVHWGVLFAAGSALHRWTTQAEAPLRNAGKLIALLFPIAIVAETLPMQRITMAPLRRVRTELQQPDRSCGAGFFFPYHMWDYWAFEETRDTKCALVNPMSEATAAVLDGIDGLSAPQLADALSCMKLSWIVFRPEVPYDSRTIVCEKLGWTRTSIDSCRAPKATPPEEIKTYGQCRR